MSPPRRAATRRANKSSSTTATKKRRETNFEIRIYDQPHYVPGQTPPQPPISLVPPRDTDAFIVDKVVTPFYVPPEQEQTVRRVLNYVVGWPDRPLARQLVPCTQILDYVSPRELEDWEYALMLRQQREKDEAEAEKQNKITRQAATGAGELQLQKKQRRMSLSSGGVPEQSRGPGRKRRGRPPNSADLTEGAAAAAMTASANTPQDTELLPRPSSAHLLAQSLPLLGAGNQRTGLPLTLPVPMPLQKLTGGLDVDSSNEGGEDAGPSLGEHAEAVATMADDWEEGDEGDEGDERDERDLVGEKAEEWPGGDGGGSTVETPSGLDTASTSSQDRDEEAERERAVLTTKVASWTSALSASGVKSTPQQLSPPPLLKSQAQPQSRPDSESSHRVSNVPPPGLPSVRHDPKVKPIRPPNIAGIPVPTLPNKATGNMPSVIGLQLPQKRKHEVLEEAMEEADGEEGEDLYEVDRLEDDLITKADEKAEPVRFFLVRWKGDWPPDQNPTWEPAENLPPNMVRRYLMKAAQRKATEIIY